MIRNSHWSRSRRSAFTLIELMLVLGILVLLGGVAVVGYTKIKASSDNKAAQAMVNDTRSAIDLYQTTMNRLPEGDTGLSALITPPDDEKDKANWAGPYFKDAKIPVDPWGTELKYEKLGDDTGTGPAYHVWSCGPDLQDGTDDDLRSWTEQK